MKQEIRAAALFAALLCAPFAAILLALMLASCSPSTSPAAPAFLGKWADDSTQAGLLITMEFRADQSARFTAFSGPAVVLQRDGTWKESAPAVIISYSQCQAGRPLSLVACDGPDTLRTADISGDSWRIGIVDSGTVTAYHFRRVE